MYIYTPQLINEGSEQQLKQLANKLDRSVVFSV